MQVQRRYESAEDGVNYLRRLLRHNRNPQFAEMVADGPSVHRRYGSVFDPANLHRLGADEFKEFLLYEHNRHWWGIHRHQAKLVSSMDRLRQVLAVLLDEDRPLVERLDWIEPTTGRKPLPGLGKAVFTPVLHVAHPGKYGVWNSVAESAMDRLRLWPEFPWKSTFGEKYLLVNGQLQAVSDGLGVDLWTLDSLWWLTELDHEPTKHQFSGGVAGSQISGFAREASHGPNYVPMRDVLPYQVNESSILPDLRVCRLQSGVTSPVSTEWGANRPGIATRFCWDISL